MNNAFDNVYGNEDVKSLFASCIKEKRLSHAYMLVGPEGCGKKTLAAAVAMELARRDGAGEELVAKIASGHSPDVLTIPIEEKRIGIDTVRSFVSTVYLTPNELDFKMYIFDDADRLTPQAQNALLKIIEEPPKRVHIFLLCRNPGALLGTVRSRVISVNMQTFDAGEVREYLIRKGGLSDIDEERASFAVKMSCGALGAVENLLNPENPEYDAYKKAMELTAMLSKKNRSVSYFEFVSALTSFADSGEKLSLMLKYMTALYRDILSAQNSEEIPLDMLDDDTAVHYAALFSVRTALAALALLTEVKGNMNFNTNLALSAFYLAENLWRIT
ncbi:MAG: AAA family ATPase [Clostridia bacterium]|nr:AAA family ATPase [Clostridia bacterium]